MNDATSTAAVARTAMKAVETGRREDWLACFAADAQVEDPVGHVPPMVGRDALAAFWDNAISLLAKTRFDVSREWDAGHEAVLVATVSVIAADGATTSYDGAFHYTIDDAGAIASLRAFWDLPAVVAALTAQD